ncbi:hypothetical protein [Streptomyces cyaneofuscatus]|uniref:hypothetical protein n=1 Tax=Streptomyces cyaneofuscatus TaxID=66883 RepID=UPI002FF4376E
MTRYAFPQDLRDAAQLALHQTQAEYEQYATTLPWSAEPMPGWEGNKQLHSGYRSSKPDSPGYTEEQRQQVAAYRARLLELSTQVVTHSFWETLKGNGLFAAHMQLKHVHDAPEPQGEAA